jgi:hypothetical protein
MQGWHEVWQYYGGWLGILQMAGFFFIQLFVVAFIRVFIRAWKNR